MPENNTKGYWWGLISDWPGISGGSKRGASGVLPLYFAIYIQNTYFCIAESRDKNVSKSLHIIDQSTRFMNLYSDLWIWTLVNPVGLWTWIIRNPQDLWNWIRINSQCLLMRVLMNPQGLWIWATRFINLNLSESKRLMNQDNECFGHQSSLPTHAKKGGHWPGTSVCRLREMWYAVMR